MRVRHFRDELWLPYPVETVFSFFSNASNLEAITPSWLHFRILTPAPIEMEKGTLIEYRLRLRGFPIQWVSEIILWEPPGRFVDAQRKGPYLQWIHTHAFTEKDNGTLIQDQVDYALHGWIFEPVIDSLLVRPDLKKIFQYRKERIIELFRNNPSFSSQCSS